MKRPKKCYADEIVVKGEQVTLIRENFMQPQDFQSRPFAAFGESLPADFRLVNLTVKLKKKKKNRGINTTIIIAICICSEKRKPFLIRDDEKKGKK